MKKELERYKEALEVATSALRDLTTFGGGRSFINGYAQGVADKVEAILNPPPEMEEVEVVRWGAYYNSDDGLIATFDSEDQARNAVQDVAGYVVRLSGTYKRPKPQPVEKSVSFECAISSWPEVRMAFNIVVDSTEAASLRDSLDGKRGTLTFTWTEPAE